MRGLILLVVLMALAFYWGGTNAWVGLKNREVTEISCADYVAHRPDAHWLKLTACEVDFENMAIETDKNQKYTAVYIPLRPAGVTEGQTHIVVKRTDEEMLTLAHRFNDSQPSEATITKARALDEQAQEGLVQFGIDMSDHDRNELDKLGLGLAPDFVIMDHGKQPRLLLGLLALVAGLVPAGFFGRGVYRRFRPVH